MPLAISASGQPPKETKRVFVLFSTQKDLPGIDLAEKGLRASLEKTEDFKIEYFFEYMDRFRFPEAPSNKDLLDLYRTKYADKKIDLFIAHGYHALDFSVSSFGQISPRTPVVFATVFDTHVKRLKLDQRFGGSLVQIDHVRLLNTALNNHPDAQQVAIISGASKVGRLIERQARKAYAPYANKYDFIYLGQLPVSSMLERLATLPKHTLVIYYILLKDGKGEAFKPWKAATMISEAANAPVYGMADTYLGSGVVGGTLLSYEASGRKAGDIGLRILNGENPGDIPISAAGTNLNMFDWRQLKRWSIDEDRLPVGSIVRYKVPSIWELYGWHILAAITVIIFQGLLIIALQVGRLRLRKAESDLRSTQSELEERLQFEEIISEISAKVADANVAAVESEITASMKKIASFLGFDRSMLFDFSANKDQIVATSHYVKDGVQPTSDVLATNQFPWFMAKVLNGEMVVFSDPADLGDDAVLERRYLEKEDIRAGIIVPLAISDVTFGAIAFSVLHSPRKWSALIVERLRLVAEILTNALTRKQSEIEAQKHRDELSHVTRVASLGELSASLAHEFSQPLTAILSNAQAARRLLSRNPPDLEEVGEILDDIVKDDQRAGHIMHRLRALMKRDKQNFAQLDLNEIIRDIVELVKSDVTINQVSVDLELSDGLPPVLGDTIQLQQVVLNLVVNGTEAMAEIEPRFRKIIISTSQSDPGAVMVSVRDLGPGVDEENIENMFKAFHTTKPEGMGMGLSICRSIVESHGGRLWAENNTDGGATFYFTIPGHSEGES